MPASEKQIAANRRNAQKSTGPRTAEGKARASLNSIKHGLAAGPHTILPHEDASAIHAERAALIESWQPANAQELQLVYAISDAWLRMQRAMRLEAALFEVQTDHLKIRRRTRREPTMDDDKAIAIGFHNPDYQAAYTQLGRYQARAESAYHRSMEQLRKLQNDRFRRERQQEQTLARRTGYVIIPAEKKSQRKENKRKMASFRPAAAKPPIAAPQPVTPSARNY